MKAEESFMTNMTKFYVMTLLNQKKTHGYEIITHLEKITGKKVSAGQIYPLLKALQKKKLVIIKTVTEENRVRKVYELTPAGRKFAGQLLERFSTLIDTAIKPSLTVCMHCGCSVYKGGFKKKVNGVNRMFCCKYCAGHY